ncbi:MAG: hypothetical protein QOJ66_1962 [Ilumatobacteraceae bacterium]|jgi:hypothetical protein
MKWLKTFGAFWYDFIVGDDWSIAVGVAAAVGATALVHHAGLVAWPIVPIVVAIMLSSSIWRARAAKAEPPAGGDGGV